MPDRDLPRALPAGQQPPFGALAGLIRALPVALLLWAMIAFCAIRLF